MGSSNLLQSLRAGGAELYLYSVCNGIELPDGLLIDTVSLDKFVVYGSKIKWTSFCEIAAPVYLSSKANLSPYPYLPVLLDEWHHLINNHDGLVQSYWRFGVYSVLLSYGGVFVITLMLTVIVFLNVRTKPHRFGSTMLKLSTIIASINISYFMGKGLKKVSDIEHKYGYISFNVIIKLATSDTTVATLNVISVFTAKLCQVDIVSRFFRRSQEQKVIFLFGVFVVCVSLVLTCISTYTTLATIDNTSLDILSPFVLLFDVTLATCYACLVIGHMWSCYRLFYKDVQLIILTLVTLIAILLSPTLFLADISRRWLSNFSSFINPTLYTCAIVMVWTWSDRINQSKNAAQAGSILGKPIYEEEQVNYNFAYYSAPHNDETSLETDDPESIMLNDMFSNSPTPSQGWRSEHSDHSSFTPKQNSTGISFPAASNQVQFQARPSYSDRIVNISKKGATSINQRFKLFTPKLSKKSEEESSRDNSMDRVRKRLGLNNTRQEYIYKSKDIIFESEEEEDDDEEENSSSSDDQDNNTIELGNRISFEEEGNLITDSQSQESTAATDILSMDSAF